MSGGEAKPGRRSKGKGRTPPHLSASYAAGEDRACTPRRSARLTCVIPSVRCPKTAAKSSHASGNASTGSMSKSTASRIEPSNKVTAVTVAMPDRRTICASWYRPRSSSMPMKAAPPHALARSELPNCAYVHRTQGWEGVGPSGWPRSLRRHGHGWAMGERRWSGPSFRRGAAHLLRVEGVHVVENDARHARVLAVYPRLKAT